MIEFKNVSKWYGDFQVLTDCTTRVNKGEVVVVCGPSGSGKSTLIKCVNALEPFQKGEIIVDGIELNDDLQHLDAIRREVGMVFQSFNLFSHLTILRNITLAPMRVRKMSRADAEAKAMALLERVGLKNQAHKYPVQLSGGQQQRVAIARALAILPSIVLADEPTANLDHKTGEEILSLMKEINRAFNTTFIFSTHDKRVIAKADRLVRVEDGEISALGVRSNSKWSLASQRRPSDSARQ